MIVARSLAELGAARAKLLGAPAGDRPRLALVPTMGALHDGHGELIGAARGSADLVAVSIFVNPMQFDRPEDLERYPRPVAADLARCAELGVDLVFLPSTEQLYPDGSVEVWVTAGALADQLEGPNRPGHFDGVLTVVTKLFHAIGPDLAFFGEKDYQQLALIRRMVRDLGFGIEVRGVPTVRDADGLARSSRNVFLSAGQRQSALSLSAGLRAAQHSAGDAETALNAAKAVLEHAEGVEVEYLELRDEYLGPPPKTGTARLLVAARVGSVRLIDNIAIELRP
ncbi:MAG: putative pantoate-amino acid ligase [Frankiales bacterium]|nr:putative pantoate-amino acid ligase [Frankiales bacterium]